MHAPRVALMARLTRETGQDFGDAVGGDSFIESHLYAGHVFQAADKAKGAIGLLLHYTQLAG